jgi:hypothetical protein
MKNNNKFLLKIIDKFSPKNSDNKKYPLLENAFSNLDILKGINVLLSRRITMSKITKKFEFQFGKFIGSKYCLMVNSGSSANLLAFFALINPNEKSVKKKRQTKTSICSSSFCVSFDRLKNPSNSKTTNTYKDRNIPIKSENPISNFFSLEVSIVFFVYFLKVEI